MFETYRVGVVLELGGNAQSGIDLLIAQMDRLEGLVNTISSGFRSLIPDLTAASSRLTAVLRENAELAASVAQSTEAAARATSTASSGSGGGRPGFGGHDLLLTSMAASAVGEPLLHAGENALDRAMEVMHLRAQILADQRVTAAQADAMVGAAYSATQTAPGSRVGTNLHALIDLKNVLGSIDEAEAMLPRFAQLTALLQVMDRRRGGQGDSAFAAARAMELMGGMVEEREVDGHTERTINPALMQTRLDMMARVAVATNARVAPEDYLRFAQTARVAGMTLSDDFIYTRLPAIMMGMGGSRAGTALMSMAQVFRGGKLTAGSMEELQGIGLAGPDGIERRGRDAIVHPEAIYDTAMLRTDPDKWVLAAQQRMEAAGIHGSADQIDALMRASQRSTIAGALADMLRDAPTIERERQNIVNTRPDIASHFAEQDPAAKLQQMEAAFDKLMTTLGGAAMSDAVKIMDMVTSGLNSMSAWGERNPGLARLLTDTAIGLGAIASALSTLALATFLFGPALWALRAVGGASAAAGAASGGGDLLGGAGRLLGGAGRLLGGALGFGGALVGGALYLGGTADPLRAQQRLEDLNRQQRGGARQGPGTGQPNDGFDTDTGRPIGKQSMGIQPEVTVVSDIRLDGDVIARVVAKHMARSGSGQSAGTTGYDLRAGWTDGLQGAVS